MQIETRSTPRPVEIRSNDGKNVAVGYAAVFYNPADPGTQYQLWEGCFERIMPGAFDRALRENQDVRGLFNHSTSQLLGRVSAGTLRLSVDNIGLRYEIDLPDNTAGNDCKVSLERRDLRESSFSFSTYENGKVTWTEENRDGQQLSIRQIEDCDVYDVGPVTFAAYDSSTAGLRSAGHESIKAEQEVWLEKRQSAKSEAEAVEVDYRTNQVMETELC